MKDLSTDAMALGLIAVILILTAFGIAGQGDYEDALVVEQEYCEMVDLWGKTMAETDIPIGENFISRYVRATDEELENWIIAIQAAQAMATRHQEDMAVLSDYRVVKLKTNDEPPLEIIRYDP